MTVVLEQLRPGRLPQALELVRNGGLAGAAAHLGQYVAVQPDGYWLAVEDDSNVVGVGGALRFGPVAFVGAMAVLPSHRGRGVGSAILQRTMSQATRHGCTTLLLEATALGAPVYARAGFVPCGVTQVWQGRPSVLTGPPPPGTVDVDWDACLRLDALALGYARGPMLAALRDGGAQVALVDGAYGMAWPGRLGPWVARDEGPAAQVLDALLPHAVGADGAVAIYVPPDAGGAGSLLEARGLTAVRQLTRMVLGPVPPGRPPWVLGLATAGMG